MVVVFQIEFGSFIKIKSSYKTKNSKGLSLPGIGFIDEYIPPVIKSFEFGKGDREMAARLLLLLRLPPLVVHWKSSYQTHRSDDE